MALWSSFINFLVLNLISFIRPIWIIMELIQLILLLFNFIISFINLGSLYLSSLNVLTFQKGDLFCLIIKIHF